MKTVILLSTIDTLVKKCRDVSGNPDRLVLDGGIAVVGDERIELGESK